MPARPPVVPRRAARFREQAASLVAREELSGDVIALDVASNGHALLVIAREVFARRGLIGNSAFNINIDTFDRFVVAAEALYDGGAGNPFHNRMHAADVMLSLHVFMHKVAPQSFGQSSLDALACCFAAMMHDFNHPGTNNGHETRVGTGRALLHSDSAVLERHHLASCFELLARPELDFLREPLGAAKLPSCASA